MLTVAPSTAQGSVVERGGQPHPLVLRLDAPGASWEGDPSKAVPGSADEARWGIGGDRKAAQGAWESEVLPLGNGELGATFAGGVPRERVNLNLDTLWTGGLNPGGGYEAGGGHDRDGFGSFQALGDLVLIQRQARQAAVPVGVPQSLGAEETAADQTVLAATDGNPGTKWCVVAPQQPLVWQVALPEEGAPVSWYAFTSADDVPARDPRSWKLEASADGEEWRVVDEHRDAQPIAGRGQRVQFALKEPVDPAQARFLRLTVEVNPGVGHLQLAEIEVEGVEFRSPARTALENYARELDLETARLTTRWSEDGVDYRREAIISHPDQVLAWRLSASRPGKVDGELGLFGAHPGLEEIRVEEGRLPRLVLRGTLPNGLIYEAQATVVIDGGTLEAGESSLRFSGCDEALVLLAADTSYVLDHTRNFRGPDPHEAVTQRLAAAVGKDWDVLREVHEADYRALFDRVALDLGSSAPALAARPLDERIGNYRQNAAELPRPCLDPELEALLFQYGRYLLIASSRGGTTAANLQGIWNCQNDPAWFADIHTNINVQMNYWLAEPANLPELAEPLLTSLSEWAPLHAEATRRQYGEDKPGFVTRMSLNIFGGSGWNWNIEGTAWMALHFWEHYAFNRDREWLARVGYPYLREVSRFWLTGLKELPDGRLVVPNVWSHEHGPYEDGTAHAQQLMWELFGDTLAAAKVLDADPALQAQLEATILKLVGPRIGSWGQLMEWMEEKPELEHSNHRHTSHLFAVYPGRQINRSTPKWLEGARVSLTERGEVGDSRRSWTWAWRTALWSRLGDAERAHGCVAGLLAHNTLPNLWTTHPPFQIDGNYGITGGMAEMFLQSQGEGIEPLPALPAAWPSGSVRGLRARGQVVFDASWQRPNEEGGRATVILRVEGDGPVKVATRLGGGAVLRSFADNQGHSRETLPELPEFLEFQGVAGLELTLHYAK